MYQLCYTSWPAEVTGGSEEQGWEVLLVEGVEAWTYHRHDG